MHKIADSIRRGLQEAVAYAKGEPMRESANMTEEDKKVLFGQTATNLPRG